MTRNPNIRLDPPPDAGAPGYEVGYGKPPTATRFPKGRSGNPRGRPKGSRNRLPALNEERLKSIVLSEAYRTIKINEGDRRISLSMAEAVIRALAVNAARGQLRSQQAFVALLSQTECSNKALYDKHLRTLVEYKSYWEEELQRRKRLGIVASDPLPHPDDIIFDLKSGQAHIKGPITKEEKVEWDRLWDYVDECDRSIAAASADLKDPKNKRFRENLLDDIRHEKHIREIIVKAIGEPKRGRNS